MIDIPICPQTFPIERIPTIKIIVEINVPVITILFLCFPSRIDVSIVEIVFGIMAKLIICTMIIDSANFGNNVGNIDGAALIEIMATIIEKNIVIFFNF